MTLGVPEFEFPRSDLRPNVHYFGGLKSKKTPNTSETTLPDWWDDVAAAKAAGKQIVAVSQGTVGTDLSNLLLPTLEALKDRRHPRSGCAREHSHSQVRSVRPLDTRGTKLAAHSWSETLTQF
jgi:hypothetical protein